MNKMNE